MLVVFRLTIGALGQFITDELSQVAAACTPQARDGLLGPEELKLSGAVLYEVDRLGVSLLIRVQLAFTISSYVQLLLLHDEISTTWQCGKVT